MFKYTIKIMNMKQKDDDKKLGLKDTDLDDLIEQFKITMIEDRT